LATPTEFCDTGPVPANGEGIGNCANKVIENYRRSATLTNTLVNRLDSSRRGIVKEKEELRNAQKLTKCQLEKMQQMIRGTFLENCEMKLETASVNSGESVHANTARIPPQCLFVLNPRLFGIAVKIQRHCFVALLDSGATENFISRKSVAKLQCRKWSLLTPMYVKVATGAEQRVEEYVKLSLYFRSTCLFVSFKVIEMDPELVLGIPFLQRFDPIINWRKKTLRFRDA